MSETTLLVDGEMFYLHLGVYHAAPARVEVWAKDEQVLIAPARLRGWWEGSWRRAWNQADISRIDLYKTVAGPILRYERALVDGVVSMPPILSVPEYQALDDRVAELYSAVRAESTIELDERREGPFVLLAGSPPPPPDDYDGSWLPTLVSALSEYPEFRHLFPGSLNGFFKWTMEAIKRLPRVQYSHEDDQRRGRSINVTIQVPYDPPRTQQKPIRPRGRKMHEVPRLMTLRRTIEVEDRILGANLTDAIEAWSKRWAEIRAEIESIGSVACGHCDGTGLLDGPKDGSDA